MAEKRSNVYTPPVFSFTDEATPSARRDDTQDVSSTLRAYTTTSEDAWPYQWITQQQPIMDGTKNVDSVTDNGGTSCLPLWSRRSIDRTRPSGSCVGMVQASPNIKEYLGLPVLTNGTRSTPRLTAHPASPGIQTILKIEAPVSHCQSTAAAVPAAITQWPAQAARAWRKHRVHWEKKLVAGMLLEPEEENCKSCVVSLEMFPAEGMPYTGIPLNTRPTQPIFTKRQMNHLRSSRSLQNIAASVLGKTTNSKAVVNCSLGVLF
ncbi:uncharacterized protein [Dermacentor andersoni]|uniref:uncharacterized protein isoform X2 n=1 Tax=Dermacentor andersoni TaxID=34620 RepID=UPI003B3B89CC